MEALSNWQIGGAPDDHLVWGVLAGASIICTSSMQIESHGSTVLTKGKQYKVRSVHPLVSPAYLLLIDDAGSLTSVDGACLRQHFTPGNEENADLQLFLSTHG